jgi:phosphatidate cytidylyltransferase
MYWAFEPGFWILLSLLVLGGLREFFLMLRAASLPHFPKTGMLLGSALTLASLAAAKFRGCAFALQVEVAVLALGVLAVFTRQMVRTAPQPLPAASIAYTVLGLAYVPFLATFSSKLLYLTPTNPDGRLSGHLYLLFLVIVTKFSDCGAYLAGSLFGRHLMIPHISPKKTWEGFAGALLLSLAGSVTLVRCFPKALALIPLPHAILLGLLLSLVAVIGDLAESIIKRSTGTKDSGHFLPGIGGAMDLIDSLLFTGPVFYFYLRFVLGA